MQYFLYILVVIIITCQGCKPDLPPEVETAYKELPEEVDYNIHVKPILSDKCYMCHGPDEAKIKAGLRLDKPESALSELPESPGKQAISPGDLADSEVFHRILSDDPDYRMPAPESNLTLSDHEKAVLIKWIEDGAEYKDHWAFIKPEKPEVPEVTQKVSINNPIDNFVQSKRKVKGYSPSEEAEKAILLRRLSLDLTGLPPTREEIDNFVNDDSPDAYEKQVDRLLASPHYGEKMAMDWMDVARFADTHGYTVDRYRDMSPYRDWVIKAFNENLAYDKFITWQLAGDLLPDPTEEQKLATAFNRLHPQNMEGGIVGEEFRVEYVSDRTNTMGQAFMALTVGCAKCHDHKYDPITQKNYYQLFSFFNNVNEAGQISWDNAMPVPTMMLETEEQEKVLDYIKNSIDQKESQLDQTKQNQQDAFQSWIQEKKYAADASRTLPRGAQALFTFDDTSLSNALNRGQKGEMKRQTSDDEKPDFSSGKQGKGLVMNGDAWFDLGNLGIYGKSEPFSIALWVNIPENIESGVIFHKGIGAALYNFKGYHLALKNNKLQLLMAHTAPDNAIIEYAKNDLPRNEWVQLTMTYDGSSRAEGLRLFMNGRELTTEVKVDNLYKDILFNNDGEPGLQIGARWRGKGIRGGKVDDIMVFDRQLTSLEVKQVGDRKSYESILAKDPNSLSEKEISMLKPYYLAHYSQKYQQQLEEIERLRTTYADTAEKVQEVMVMKEMDEPRQTNVLERGQYNAPGEEVFPNTPESVMPMPDSLPRNRLGLARWLVHPDHPLTARVAVNRYWQNYFGRGIVKTTGDFGNQGELPSHPELLDWLAVNFRESGWDVKALQKMIVMSATYRQQSKVTKELRKQDPDNVWLARGPSRRLSAEMIRDVALAASGLLNDKIGGASVKPYQPEGLWKVNGGEYVQDTGQDLYRRSMYTFWKRSIPNPTTATFDRPNRSECIVRRQETNTPLQALVLLNDPTFVEASRVLGEEMVTCDQVETGIKMAFERLTGRPPQKEELKVLAELHEQEYNKFKTDEKRAKGWLSSGAYEVPNDQNLDLIAANSVVASTIMNADATITKR